MKTASIIQWYMKHSEDVVLFVYLPVSGLVVYSVTNLFKLSGIYFLSVIASVALSATTIYYFVKRAIKKKCSRYVLKASREFKNKPTLESKVHISGIDAADIEILSTIRELGCDYWEFIPSLTRLFSADEILRRLGKLHVLEHVRVYDSRVSITPDGLDASKLPPRILKASVPLEIASRLMQTRALLSEGNYGGVIDNVNKLLEHILRMEFQKRHRDKLETEWVELVAKKIVRTAYLRAGLGELLAAARAMRIITQDDIYDHFISVFLKLRAPEKHETAIPSDTVRSAETALSIAENFCRHWFQ